MRVYEFAKKNKITSREVLNLLDKGGFELASHMSVIPEEGLKFLNDNFKSLEAELKESVKEEIKKAVAEEKYQKVSSVMEQTEKIVEPKILKEEKRIEKKIKEKQEEEPSPTKITESKPLFEVAELMGKPCGDLILVLLKKGMICNRNHILSIDIIRSLAEHFDIKFIFSDQKNLESEEKFQKRTMGTVRWPIVVVMGHVDHGKTTFLDFIRKMNTAAKEHGGITQHLGAYEVDSLHGKIIFLDTPGHEAFSYMRLQGVKATDIAVLIIAADDGIMPQTVEAIEYAKKANIPIVVAINKIDKVNQDIAVPRIKRQLAEHDILVEDWGGDIVCVPISAKTGSGINELLEMIVLQAEMLDLKADKNLPAKAFILESNIEKGFGSVSTVIPLEGIIKKGDYFICGNETGRVRLLINSFGERINQAGPAVPVKIVGFDNSGELGSWLQVVSFQKYKKVKSSNTNVMSSGMTFSQALSSDILKDQKQINLILKTDTRGSKEAVEGAIGKLSILTKKDYAPLVIVYSGIGDISENDIELANITNSYVLGLHVRIERKASDLAKNKNIIVKNFNIIYQLIQYIEERLEKTRKIEKVWKKIGKLLVKKVFDIKKIGIIAGCSVLEGVVAKGNKVVCMRRGKKIGEGLIISLQKEGKVVKEVHAGYECGFISDIFSDWQEGDYVDIYSEVKPAK